MSNKFKERRNGEDITSRFCKPSKSNQGSHKKEKASNQSSFLDSIQDRSSSIFSIRSKKDRNLEQVRKRVDEAWDNQTAVLYDDSHDFESYGIKNNKLFSGSKKGKMVKHTKINDDESCSFINQEISRFLRNDKYSFDLLQKSEDDGGTDEMSKIPNFKDNDTPNPQQDWSIDEVEAPNIPSGISFSSHNLTPAILTQLVTISEIYQPDEDDLAERILSNSSEPFSVNFDIDDGHFKIDFDLLPVDSRNKFIAKSTFSCLTLNSDKKINVYGYILDPTETKEPLLIPKEKVKPCIASFPISAKREYSIKDWNDNSGEIFTTNMKMRNNKEESKDNKTTKQLDLKSENHERKSFLFDPNVDLSSGFEAKVKSVGYLTMDFNVHPICQTLTQEVEIKIPNINILSGYQGDMV